MKDKPPMLLLFMIFHVECVKSGYEDKEKRVPKVVKLINHFPRRISFVIEAFYPE